MKGGHFLFNTIGALLYNIIAAPVNALLKFTVWFLQGIVLSPANIPPGIETLWIQAVTISTVLITTVTIYAYVKSSAQSLSGGGEDGKEIFGRAIISVILAQISWTVFVNFLIPLNNTVVSGILTNIGGIKFDVAAGWALPTIGATTLVGSAIGAAALSLGAYFILALLAILYILAAIISWVVWLVRNVEIIILLIVAPIAASFMVLKNSNAWRWVFNELVSAIFSQSILALFIYVSFYLMTGAAAVPMKWDTSIVINPTDSILYFALGVTALFLSFKSHNWVKGMLTGQSVVEDHSGLAVAAGYALARHGSHFAPPQAHLAMKTAVGQLGFGEFSKAGRALAVAKQANTALGQIENQGVVSQMQEAHALSNTATMQNPYTRKAMAEAIGLKQEIHAQGIADNVINIQSEKQRGHETWINSNPYTKRGTKK